MKPFEFVLVILSLIIGLSLTEAAIGISYMIQNYKVAHFYFPFVALIIVGCLNILNYYATLFKLRKLTTWNAPKIGLLFMTGLIYFVLTQIYFPDQEGFDQDYERYFNENITIVLTLLDLFILSFMLEAYVIRKVRRLKLYITFLAFALVVFSGVVISNPNYRAVLPVILLVLQIYNLYAFQVKLEEEES